MLTYNIFLDTDGDRRPEPLPPPPQVGGDLAPPSARDQRIRVEAKPPSNALGTAFAISDEGWWLTARHVVDGCQKVVLSGEQAESVILHPRADVALIKTRESGPPLPFSDAALKRNQPGFHFGFPQGKPTAVESQLLGRSILTTRGYRVGKEPTVSWVERRRVPALKGPLGGMSGGPSLDGNGDIVGIAIASSPRRGRIESAARQSILSLVNGRVPRTNLTTGTKVSSETLTREERKLRERGSVVTVYCYVS